MPGAGERIALVDLRLDEARHQQLCAAVARVAQTGRFVLGPAVESFEHRLARAVGVDHAVTVGSGSDALLLALIAAGVAPGDVVVTSPLTFVATAEAIVRAGAVPRFVDVDERSLCLSPAAVGAYLDGCRRRDGRSVDPTSGAPVRALLPIHLYGRVADLKALRALAHDAGLTMVHDAAQAIGAREGDAALGRREPACLSFFPTKNLGAWGDGGAVLCHDAAMAERIRALRVHGAVRPGEHRWVGLNSRLDALQAAVLEVKLEWLADVNQIRARHAAAYGEAFSHRRPGLGGRLTSPPPLGPGDVCHLYTVRVAGGARAQLRAYLDEHGIDTRVYYPRLVCDEPAFASLRGASTADVPNARRATVEVLSLPVHERLGDDAIERVVESIVAGLDAIGALADG